jgi:hypothetical protein
LTRERFDELLDALGWGGRTLAVKLGEHWTTVRRWRKDPSKVPDNVARWLEQLARPALEHPLPDGWRRKVEYVEGKPHGKKTEAS